MMQFIAMLFGALAVWLPCGIASCVLRARDQGYLSLNDFLGLLAAGCPGLVYCLEEYADDVIVWRRKEPSAADTPRD